jgi:hypothetical protein
LKEAVWSLVYIMAVPVSKRGHKKEKYSIEDKENPEILNTTCL